MKSVFLLLYHSKQRFNVSPTTVYGPSYTTLRTLSSCSYDKTQMKRGVGHGGGGGGGVALHKNMHTGC